MTEQPDFNGVDWDDLPPNIQQAIIAQATNIDLHRMAHEEIAHQFPKLVEFILDNDKTGEQLVYLRNVLDQGFQSDGTLDLHKSGVVSGVLSARFGHCMTCGGKHDDPDTEVKKLMEAAGAAILKPSDPNESDQAWGNFVANFPPEITQNMAEYNMILVFRQYPKVKCNKCGGVFVSLEDRMIKKDCHFCQLMDATGERP